jgi:hypothetical protein
VLNQHVWDAIFNEVASSAFHANKFVVLLLKVRLIAWTNEYLDQYIVQRWYLTEIGLDHGIASGDATVDAEGVPAPSAVNATAD